MKEEIRQYLKPGHGRRFDILCMGINRDEWLKPLRQPACQIIITGHSLMTINSTTVKRNINHPGTLFRQ